MIQAVVRAFRILEYLSARNEEVGLTEIARATHLEKQTIYNLIKTLTELGYVEQSELRGKYKCSPKLIKLASGEIIIEHLYKITYPLIKEIGQKINETIVMATYWKGEMKIITRVSCNNEIVVKDNPSKPLYTTITGRCLLAQLPKEEIEIVIQRYDFPGNLWDNITTKDKLYSALFRISQDKYYILLCPQRQIGGIGYIIKNSLPFPLALGTAMPLERFLQKREYITKILPYYIDRISKITSNSVFCFSKNCKQDIKGE